MNILNNVNNKSCREEARSTIFSDWQEGKGAQLYKKVIQS
jgi:hypothetical protein